MIVTQENYVDIMKERLGARTARALPKAYPYPRHRGAPPAPVPPAPPYPQPAGDQTRAGTVASEYTANTDRPCLPEVKRAGAGAPIRALIVSLKLGLHATYQNIRYSFSIPPSALDLWQAGRALVRSALINPSAPRGVRCQTVTQL